MSRPVRIVDYDPQWPILYEEEKRRILVAAGDIIVRIEHIGSTAVPNIGAKPIVDLIVAVNHLNDAEKCIEPLQRIGYEYQPEHEASTPERRFFRKGRPPKEQHYHLHMVELTSDFWKRHLLFRDYLRTHPDVGQEYYELKKKLADKYGSDREGYTEAKTSFIESVVAMRRQKRECMHVHRNKKLLIRPSFISILIEMRSIINKPEVSKTIALTYKVLVVLTAIVTVFFSYAAFFTPMEIIGIVASIVSSIVGLIILLILLSLYRTKYILTERELIVKTSKLIGGSKTIPLKTVKHIEKTIIPFGIKLFGASFHGGHYHVPSLGRAFLATTNFRDGLLIKTSQGSYVITPRNPLDFKEAIENRKRKI